MHRYLLQCRDYDNNRFFFQVCLTYGLAVGQQLPQQQLNSNSQQQYRQLQTVQLPQQQLSQSQQPLFQPQLQQQLSPPQQQFLRRQPAKQQQQRGALQQQRQQLQQYQQPQQLAEEARSLGKRQNYTTVVENRGILLQYF
jgi:hypothetical protein